MLTIDIVTPTKKLVEGLKADSIKLPGVKGQLEILTNHADLLTLLEPGVVSFVQDGRERKFAVSFGFAEVKNNKVTVMGETVEDSTQIDIPRAKAAQKKAEEALQNVLSEEHFKKHQLKLERAIIRQHIGSGQA